MGGLQVSTSVRRPTHWLAALAAVGAMALGIPETARSQETAEATAEPTAEQQAFFDALGELNWVRGPASVETEGHSTLQVPEGFVYLDQKDTLKFLELNRNLGDGNEVLIAPDDLSWSAYLDFLDEGYVKDDEQIDADALLESLKENTAAANEERRNRGWPELEVVGWAVAPDYNRETRRLEWATTIQSDNGRSTNFFTKILGRRGHTSVQMVAPPDELAQAEAKLNEVLTGYSFKTGDTYADFRPGDKVAEYGLAAMVVGGAAAVATKKGFWGVLAGFFAAAWKFIVAAAVAAGAAVKKFFAKKE